MNQKWNNQNSQIAFVVDIEDYTMSLKKDTVRLIKEIIAEYKHINIDIIRKRHMIFGDYNIEPMEVISEAMGGAVHSLAVEDLSIDSMADLMLQSVVCDIIRTVVGRGAMHFAVDPYTILPVTPIIEFAQHEVESRLFVWDIANQFHVTLDAVDFDRIVTCGDLVRAIASRL